MHAPTFAPEMMRSAEISAVMREKEERKPLMGCALSHPKQPPLHDLKGVSLRGSQDAQQLILGRGQRAVLVCGIPAGSAGSLIEAPRGHMSLKCRLKGSDQGLKLIDGETGHIAPLCRAGPDVGELSRIA